MGACGQIISFALRYDSRNSQSAAAVAHAIALAGPSLLAPARAPIQGPRMNEYSALFLGLIGLAMVVNVGIAMAQEEYRLRRVWNDRKRKERDR